MRIGVIGRGFGLRVVAPAFEQTEGCHVLDVVSPRDEAGVSALCRRQDVDLISVHSPPFMHLEHVRLAIDAGHAVLCDKPFGLNAAEGNSMVQMAVNAGVVNLVNFEMRYDPLRQRLRGLIHDGSIGPPEHMLHTTYVAITRTPLRPYGWLFDAALGGGWTGAWGSHIIDFVAWALGEVVDASAQVHTNIAERPDAEGRMHHCTADDTFTAMLATAAGATATIEGTSVAPANLPPQTLIMGSGGMLEVAVDSTIRRYDGVGTHEELVPDHGGGDLTVPMSRWAVVVRDSVRQGTAGAGVPTFSDGLACRQVLDRVVQGARRPPAQRLEVS